MYWRTKTLTWLADSRSKVKSFPAGVQDDIGYALYAAQLGEHSPKAKPLHGLGSHVMQIAACDASGTYGAVYTVSIGRSPRPGSRRRSRKWTLFGSGSDS
jgi:phage-related protein